jgi:type II secretory pathway component PulF
MALYRYEAADPSGKLLRGAMDAPSALEVRQRLEGRGFRGVTVLTAPGQTQTAAPTTVPADRAVVQGTTPSAPAEALGLFFRQLASLANAGFTTNAALSNLAPRTAHRGLARAGQAMAQITGQGGSLADAMAAQGGLFPPHMVGLVSAGEAGGFLPFAFEEAALGAEHDAALRQNLWWPKFLIWQGIWSVLLFAPFFPSLDPNHLPESLVRYGRWALLLTVFGIGLHIGAWLLGRWWATPAAATTRDRLSLRIPVMARLARLRALAAFTRVLRRLLASGISPEAAYAGAVEAVPNGAIQSRLRDGLPVLRRAGGIDAAIEATGVMDHDPLQLLVTGQQTGQWTETLDQIAAFYQDEAARATEAARTAIKRAGGIITLVTMGYVTIATVYGLSTIGFKLTDGWAE